MDPELRGGKGQLDQGTLAQGLKKAERGVGAGWQKATMDRIG